MIPLFDRIKNSTKLIRKRPAHRMRMALHAAFHPGPKDPVFVLTTRRSGSNLLLDCLKSIPGTSFRPEALNKRMFYGIRAQWISRRAVFRHLRHTIAFTKSRLCGTKLTFTQMKTHRLTVEDLTSHFPNAKFIVIYRRSIFDQFISLKIAEATRIWCWKSENFVLPEMFDIDAAEMLAFSKEIRGFYSEITARPWLASSAVFVEYEELAQDPQRLFDRVIFPFLGRPSSKVSYTTRKQNTKEPHELVRNFEELRHLVFGESLIQKHSFAPPAEVPA